MLSKFSTFIWLLVTSPCLPFYDSGQVCSRINQNKTGQNFSFILYYDATSKMFLCSQRVVNTRFPNTRAGPPPAKIHSRRLRQTHMCFYCFKCVRYFSQQNRVLREFRTKLCCCTWFNYGHWKLKYLLRCYFTFLLFRC